VNKKPNQTASMIITHIKRYHNEDDRYYNHNVKDPRHSVFFSEPRRDSFMPTLLHSSTHSY